MAFYILGLPGLIWAVCWLIWFRDFPRDRIVHENTIAGPEQSVGTLLRSRGMLLAMFQYFAGNFTFYICISWMHPYLLERYGLTQSEAARYAMVPLLCGAAANWAAGLLVDALYKSSYRTWSRRIPGMTGFVLAAAGILWVSVAGSASERDCRVRRRDLRRRDDDQPQLELLPGRRRQELRHDLGGHEHGRQLRRLREHECVSAASRADRQLATYFHAAALLNIAAILCWRLMPGVGSPVVPARPR